MRQKVAHLAVVAVGLMMLTFGGTVARGENKHALDLKIENATGSYDIAVVRGESEATLDITLEKPGGSSEKVAHYASFISFVYARPSYPRMDHLITLWETGSGVTTIIFRLSPPSSQEEIVFNQTSDSEPDFLHDGYVGDLMLFYSGKQFANSDGLYVPINAALYLWNGDKYELLNTVKYANRFDAVMRLEREKRSQFNRTH